MRQRSPIVGVLRMCWLLWGSFDCFCRPHTSVHRPSVACLAVFLCGPGALFLHALSGPSTICPFPPHGWSAPDGLPLLLRKQPGLWETPPPPKWVLPHWRRVVAPPHRRAGHELRCGGADPLPQRSAPQLYRSAGSGAVSTSQGGRGGSSSHPFPCAWERATCLSITRSDVPRGHASDDPPRGTPACTGGVGFFTCGGGGGSIEPPQKLGGGFGKRAQLTGTINQSL